MTYARTYADLAENMEFDLGLEYGYIIPDATVAGKLVDAFTRSEETIRIVGFYRQTIGISDLTGAVDVPDFKDDANTLIDNQEWDAFFEKYGAYFCEGILTGGDLFVHTALTTTSVEDAKALELAIDSNVTATTPVGFYGSLKNAADQSGVKYTSTTDSFVKGAVIGVPEYVGNDLDSAAAGLVDYINNFVKKIDENPSPMAAQMRGYWDFDPRLRGLFDQLVTAKTNAYEFEALAAALFDLERCVAEVELRIGREGLSESKVNRTERKSTEATLADWYVLLRNCYARMSVLSDYKAVSECADLEEIDLGTMASRITALRRSILDDHLVFGECYKVQFRDGERYFSEPSKHKPSDMIADGATLKLSDNPDDDNVLLFTRP